MMQQLVHSGNTYLSYGSLGSKKKKKAHCFNWFPYEFCQSGKQPYKHHQTARQSHFWGVCDWPIFWITEQLATALTRLNTTVKTTKNPIHVSPLQSCLSLHTFPSVLIWFLLSRGTLSAPMLAFVPSPRSFWDKCSLWFWGYFWSLPI